MAEMNGFTTGTSLHGLCTYSEKAPEIDRMTLFAERAPQCLRERR